MLFPYGGPLPVGHTVHDGESAAWREWAAMVYPRAACASPWTRRSAGHSRTSPRSLGAGTSTVLKLNRGTQLRAGSPDPRILDRAATEEGIRHSGPRLGCKAGASRFQPLARRDNRSMTTHESRPSSTQTLPVIAPCGEFDIDNLAPLEAQIETLIAAHSGLALDASGITFADSMFLRLILATHQRTDLRIAAPSPTVARLLGVVGADTFLQIHPTLEAARIP